MEEQLDVIIFYDGETYREKLYKNWSVATTFSLCNFKWFKQYFRFTHSFYYFRNDIEYWPDFSELAADDDPFPGKLYKVGAHCKGEIEDLNTLIKDLPEKTLSFYDILTVSAEIVLYLIVQGKRIQHCTRQYTTNDFKYSYDQYLLSCAYPRLNEINTFYEVNDLKWINTKLCYVKNNNRYICYNIIHVKKTYHIFLPMYHLIYFSTFLNLYIKVFFFFSRFKI